MMYYNIEYFQRINSKYKHKSWYTKMSIALNDRIHNKAANIQIKKLKKKNTLLFLILIQSSNPRIRNLT